MENKSNFYDYGMAVEYVNAKKANDVAKIKELQHTTYHQYMNLAHKMKWDLIKRLQQTHLTSSQIYDITESYEHDVYCELVKAMDSIRLEKIPNRTNKQGKRTWTFYAAYWGYLMTYNRDTVHHYIEVNKNEMSVDYNQASSDNNGDANQFLLKNKAALKSEECESRSPERIYEEKLEKQAFWSAVNNCLNKKFNPTQVKIWNIRSTLDKTNRKSIATICKEINISPREYHKEMKGIKETFKRELDITSGNLNIL